jgi:hypothetical protein
MNHHAIIKPCVRSNNVTSRCGGGTKCSQVTRESGSQLEEGIVCVSQNVGIEQRKRCAPLLKKKSKTYPTNSC